MTPSQPRIAVVGPGRLGSALAPVIGASGPFGRAFDDGAAADFDVVLLCVPDGEIATAAAALTPRDGLLVGHCSGATTLTPLLPHEAFSLHPLMTVTVAGAEFAGVPAAVAGATPRALAAAEQVAALAGLVPFAIADEDRAAYHAAASVASNFLVTLEWTAERLFPGDGGRAALAPLVRASVENWAASGPRAALTGPVARGDEATVARQRAAVAEREPDALELFDVLTDRTRALAAAP